ncbi:MAG: AAA family ATPase [Crocosphaera sp.]|nr:AAA family ATPase [Crocosphaera sp.]
MKIKELTLTNYRAARHLTLNLHPRLNVFVGVNGAGKSTILDAVATMLSWTINRIRRAGTSGRPISEDHITNGQSFGSIELNCSNGDKNISWRLSKSRKGHGSPPNPSSLTFLNEYTKTIQSQIASQPTQANLPIFVHYHVNRAVVDIPLRIRKKNTFDQLAAYEDAFTSGVNFRQFFGWFREREDLENEQRRYQDAEIKPQDYCFPDPQLEAVRNALSQVLPSFSNLTVRRNPLRMEIQKNGQTFKVDQLSDGEKCLIAMISDLARRLAIANPTNDPLTGEGIILIDEIDLHLHPKWQRMIVPQLVKVFPNCQFLLSTHSPHVLTHIYPENIFLLKQTNDNIEVKRPSESYGKNVDRILEDLMELDTTRPDKVESDLHQIYEMIDSNQLGEAEEAIAQMIETIGNDPELVKAEVLMRRKELIGK